jgi:hypothetical protein
MKVTINGKVSKDVLNTVLEEQKEKINTIEAFCKTHKINEISYKDNELEYVYEKQVAKPKEVEKR